MIQLSDKVDTNENSEPRPAIDAAVRVIIKDNGMTACVNITPPLNGGLPPTAELLSEALKNEVTTNLNYVKLRMLVLQPVYNENVVVAVGTEPINGEDGRLNFAVNTVKKGKPREVEGGKVDYYDLGLIENVYKGQILCTITPPTEGTPGITVKGEVVKQKQGKPMQIAAGTNTELSADGTQITSKIDGQFEFDGKKVYVNETYTLNQDVDSSTGNLKVAGNLIVRGMVASGFTIEAGGFINVVGVVESATVSANGDINLQGGTTGSTITSGGNLKAKYIENCKVFVRGDLKAEYIFNSSVRCKKNLKTDGAISKIIGGTCIVGLNVDCRTIGSAAGIKTKLEIGNDPEVIDRQHSLTEQIPELEKQMKSLEPLLKLLHQLEAADRLDDEKRSTLEKASFSHEKYSAAIEDAKRELLEINNSLYTKSFGKVICHGIVYPGTIVTIGSAVYTVTQELMHTSLYYSEGEVLLGSAR